MKTCSHCYAPVAFKDVLLAVNPARFSCHKCKQSVKVKTSSAIVITLLASLLCVAILAGLSYLGFGYIVLLVAFGIVIILIEIGYFLGLKMGWIGSNLVTDPAPKDPL